jgi:hypothetical protein
MNPIVLSTIIASAAFILSVFGASWLNQRAITQSQQDYRDFTKMLMAEIDKRLVEIAKRLDAKFDAVNYRFDAVDARLTGIEQRLDRLETAIFKPVVSR